MSYKELLEFVEKNDINVYDLTVANEVDFVLSHLGGRHVDNFEKICNLVGDAYLKVDCLTTLTSVAVSVVNLVFAKGRDINTLTRKEIIENII